jgi:hypothetical protein
MFLYCFFGQGAWRAGRAGFIWAQLRVEVFRMREYKRLEMEWQGKIVEPPPVQKGYPDPRVRQIDAKTPLSETTD